MSFEQLYPVIYIGVLLASVYVLFKQRNSQKNSSSSTESKKIKVANKIRNDIKVQEVSKHNVKDDCWIIVDGKVYDVTDYVDDHPGGDSILNNAGNDSTVGVHGPQHPESVWEVLKLFYIGDVVH